MTVTRNELVNGETVKRIASEFLEWLDSLGVEFTLPMAHANDDFVELAGLFVEYLANERDGRIL